MDKYFVYIEWGEYDIPNNLINFSTLEGAKSWILTNREEDSKMTLFWGREVHFEYKEEIKIKSEKSGK